MNFLLVKIILIHLILLELSYWLNNKVQVNLSVYDMLGRKVAELVNTKQPAGSYDIQFDASMASGTYFYKLTAGDLVSAKKMVLLSRSLINRKRYIRLNVLFLINIFYEEY